MHDFRARPLSRYQIRELANEVRSQLHLSKELYLPILQLVEHILPKIDDKYHFKVVESAELGSSHGLTINEDDFVTIEIREDVYLRACRGEGRDRGTVTHEFGHYLMHARSRGLHRNFSGATIKTFEDPEWQAKCFQGEILVPKNLVKGMSASEVAKECGVSYDAAAYQLMQYAK